MDKAIRVILILLCTSVLSLAQDADESGLDSLSLPSADSSKPKEVTASDLSLPSETTANATIKKGSSGLTGSGKDNVGAILDFEGEVIEGERRRPDLFLQISIDNIKFDSLIYNRDDFNDYLEVDRKSRTRFLKMK